MSCLDQVIYTSGQVQGEMGDDHIGCVRKERKWLKTSNLLTGINHFKI